LRVAGKTVISTPYPSVYGVAKKLGVPKERATCLIQLADSIRVTDSVSVGISESASVKRSVKALKAQKAKAVRAVSKEKLRATKSDAENAQSPASHASCLGLRRK